MGVAIGIHHSISLQPHASIRRLSCSVTHLPHQKAVLIRTSAGIIRAGDEDSCRRVAWFRKKRGIELLLKDLLKPLRRSENFFLVVLHWIIAWRFRSLSIRTAASSAASLEVRSKCCATGGGGEIMEGDVVEYPLPEDVRQGGLYGDRSYGLGAVSELVADKSSPTLLCHIEPLVMVEPPKPSWVVDERQDMVVLPLTEVRRLEAWLSERMVDDRISNPHGEHAEHLWLVEEPLSESSGSPMYDTAAAKHD